LFEFQDSTKEAIDHDQKLYLGDIPGSVESVEVRIRRIFANTNSSSRQLILSRITPTSSVS
jgi:hypothetical protein